MSARFVSFRHGATGKPGWGLIVGTGIVDLSARHESRWPTLRAAMAEVALHTLAETVGNLKADIALSDATLEIPVPDAGKILCVGVNYPERNEEYRDGSNVPQWPSLFVRFARSFVGHGAALVRPSVSTDFDYEGELVIIIGKPGRHISEAHALDHIAGLTLANDGSVRDWVRHGKFNVTQGKNFDASGSIGPWCIPYRSEAQIADIRLTTRVNGETRQDDRTSRMMFGVRRLISYISTFTTLEPGDTILTGTPAGSGGRLDPPVWLKAGDTVEVEADGLGILRNPIVDEGAP